MIISKKKYNTMNTIIRNQKELIKLLEDQILTLKQTICECMVQQPHDIDFPATKKLHEDKLF